MLPGSNGVVPAAIELQRETLAPVRSDGVPERIFFGVLHLDK